MDTPAANRRCAWCGAALGYEPALAPGAVSDGICATCIERHFPNDTTPIVTAADQAPRGAPATLVEEAHGHRTD